MKNEVLSNRLRQPGDDQTYKKSEKEFYDLAQETLNQKEFLIIAKPKDFSKFFENLDRKKCERKFWGLYPDFSIEKISSKFKLFIEIKKQDINGNANERACKNFTTQFQKTIHGFLLKEQSINYNFHPFFIIFCEELAKRKQYTIKHEKFFDAEHYLNWIDYDKEILKKWLNKTVEKFL
jgi:hypothetical protein